MAVTPTDREHMRRSLGPWLTSKLQEASGAAVSDLLLGPLVSPASGQSNTTVLFTATWSEGPVEHRSDYVLRLQPTSYRLFLDADVLREFRVLSALARHSSVPVPTMLWAEPSAEVVGAPFFVMSRVEGTVPFGKPSIHSTGWLPTLSPEERARVWSAGLEVLVAVHEVDWRRTHPFLVERDPAAVALAAHLERLDRWYSWATRGRSFPVTDAALHYLKAKAAVVQQEPPVLLWGDARIGNMIFADDLTVAAAIDWEVASIGPAGVDLGYWLFFDEFYTGACEVDRLEGFPDRATTIARYEALSGRGLEDLEYFELLAALLLAVTLIRQADIRVGLGELPADTRLGHDNSVTQLLARRLDLPVPELSPDYVARRRNVQA